MKLQDFFKGIYSGPWGRIYAVIDTYPIGTKATPTIEPTRP